MFHKPDVGDEILKVLGIVNDGITDFSLNCPFEGVPTITITRVLCELDGEHRTTKTYRIEEVAESDRTSDVRHLARMMGLQVSEK